MTNQVDVRRIPIIDIIVTSRQRKQFGNMEALADSIKRVGQITPICVEKQRDKYLLIAGERRLRACKMLGLTHIEAKMRDELTELERLDLELEENLHKTLEWFEEAELRTKIHNLRQQLHGSAVKGHADKGWGMEDTAQALGVSRAMISKDIALVEAAQLIPKIKQFGSKQQALKFLSKAKETIILEELARRNKLLSEDASFKLYNDDAINVLQNEIPDESIDLVIFDPPWGIDADAYITNRGVGGGEKVTFDDSEQCAIELALKLFPELYRVLKMNTHMYLFTGREYSDYWKALLRCRRHYDGTCPHVKHGVKRCLLVDPRMKNCSDRDLLFNVRDTELIWLKEGGGYTDFEVRFMPRYECILYCTKGIRRISQPRDDVFEVNRPSTITRIHTQQKPVDLLKQFIRLSTVRGETVLDPCMGSGASIVSAATTGRKSIGIEMDKDSFNKACHWIQGTTFGDEDDET